MEDAPVSLASLARKRVGCDSWRLHWGLFLKRFYQVKIKGLDVTSLKELGRLMGPLQPLRCFMFGDFQIVPTVEEFEEILGCPLGGRKPYLFSGFLPSLSKITAVVRDSARELDRIKQTRNSVVGLPRKYLEGKARDMANQEEWVPFADEGKEGVLFSCGDYPNIPLIGTRGCINYNPALAIRQLGYLMRGAPTEESLSPFLVRDFGAQSFKIVQRVHKAWESPLRKDKELRGIRNGIIGGYHEWLKVHTRGLDWLSKLKIINEENFEAPEEDEEVRALKTEENFEAPEEENFKHFF
ncbi:hypothetical protein GmHk_04G010912 [Glycine max]|nr:hypothetical protein GmHk_04G010912 [Glycine max]